MNINLANAKINIFKIAEKNNLSPEFFVSIAFGVCQLLEIAFGNINNITKFINEEFLIFLKNRKMYYNGIGLMKYLLI